MSEGMTSLPKDIGGTIKGKIPVSDLENFARIHTLLHNVVQR